MTDREELKAAYRTILKKECKIKADDEVYIMREWENGEWGSYMWSELNYEEHLKYVKKEKYVVASVGDDGDISIKIGYDRMCFPFHVLEVTKKAEPIIDDDSITINGMKVIIPKETMKALVEALSIKATTLEDSRE